MRRLIDRYLYVQYCTSLGLDDKDLRHRVATYITLAKVDFHFKNIVSNYGKNRNLITSVQLRTLVFHATFTHPAF